VGNSFCNFVLFHYATNRSALACQRTCIYPWCEIISSWI